jgi:hypothetical protein
MKYETRTREKKNRVEELNRVENENCRHEELVFGSSYSIQCVKSSFFRNWFHLQK